MWPGPLIVVQISQWRNVYLKNWNNECLETLFEVVPILMNIQRTINGPAWPKPFFHSWNVYTKGDVNWVTSFSDTRPKPHIAFSAQRSLKSNNFHDNAYPSKVDFQKTQLENSSYQVVSKTIRAPKNSHPPSWRKKDENCANATLAIYLQNEEFLPTSATRDLTQYVAWKLPSNNSTLIDRFRCFFIFPAS